MRPAHPRLDTDPPPIQTLDHSTEHHLEYSIRRKYLRTRPAVPGHCVHHIPHAATLLRQPVVELLERLSGAELAADLEELDADLVGRGVELVELLGDADDDRFRVVGGHAVGDDNHVDGLHATIVGVPGARDLGLVVAQVGLDDLVDARSRRGAAGRTHPAEEALDLVGVPDAAVPALGVGAAARVEEVDVDAVNIVGGADRGDGAQGFLDFSPGAPGHGPAVVDQEDGVEGAEEGVGILGRCDAWVGAGRRA